MGAKDLGSNPNHRAITSNYGGVGQTQGLWGRRAWSLKP